MSKARLLFPEPETPVTTTSSGISGATVKRQLSAETLQPSAVVRLTSADVQNPERLARALSDQAAATQQAMTASRTNPLGGAGGVRFKNITALAGVPFLLRHNMSRPYEGYLVTRCQGATWITLVETALPQGLTAMQAVNLVPSGSGVIDVMVL